MDEIELKLQLAEADAAKLRASGSLPGKGRAIQQHAVYWDSPEEALAAAGMSLRIRTAGPNRVQTLKTRGTSAAGLFARPEIEHPAKGERPELPEDSPVLAVVSDAAELLPLYDVQVLRRTWDVTTGSTSIEVVLDTGTARSGDRRSPICEIELELKKGDPKAMFDLARKLDQVAPLRLGVLTKSERGTRLRQAIAAAVKAEPVPLAAPMTAAEALQAILSACIRQFRLNEDLIFPARAPEALHQARVALRRIRSAFSVFKPVLGTEGARDLRDRLKELAAELGAARDLDVLLAKAGPGPLQDRLRAERERAYDRVEAVLASDGTRALMLDLAEWTFAGPWLEDAATLDHRQQPAPAFAAEALKRFRRKVKKDGRNLSQLPDGARHELRKDSKKLRYAAEFFAAFYDGTSAKAHAAFLRSLEKLQDHLGTLNDLATAPVLLERLGLAADPAAEPLRAGPDKAKVLGKAEKAHGKLMDAPRFWH